MEVSFGTDGWRAQQTAITDDRLRAVAGGVTRVLDEPGPLAIGYDARANATDYAETLADAVAETGRDVLLTDRDCPTPALATAIGREDCAGGLMVTASHNPPEYCGVKFIPADGAPAPTDVTDAIEAHLGEPTKAATPGAVDTVDLIDPYIGTVCERVDADLSGLTVAYDAMHGSGRGVTDRVLRTLGADVERLRCERDPDFGGGAPNPTPERLETLQARVDGDTCALGLATDGDADRVTVVTPTGVIGANQLFAALYDWLLETHQGPAVRTVSTTALIDRIARDHGASVIETPVGFKHVAAAMRKHDALMGGEESGGFTVRGHLPNKDGSFIGALAAAATVETPLADRLDRIAETYGRRHSGRVSVDCPDAEKDAAMAAVETTAPATLDGEAVVETNAIDGVKLILASDDWVLIRPSGTEPKLRIYAEADTADRRDRLLAAGQTLVAEAREPQ